MPGRATKPPLAGACPVNPCDLMETVRRLAESGSAQPTQADARHRRGFAVHVPFKRRQPREVSK